MVFFSTDAGLGGQSELSRRERGWETGAGEIRKGKRRKEKVWCRTKRKKKIRLLCHALSVTHPPTHTLSSLYPSIFLMVLSTTSGIYQLLQMIVLAFGGPDAIKKVSGTSGNFAGLALYFFNAMLYIYLSPRLSFFSLPLSTVFPFCYSLINKHLDELYFYRVLCIS